MRADHPLSLFTVANIRNIENNFAAQHPGISLMQRAGEASARHAEQMLANGGRILVLAGPGNNGGDAWVCARALQATWHEVTVLALGEPKAAEAVAAKKAFLAHRGSICTDWPGGKRFDLVIDGLLGIGLARPVEGRIAELIAQCNATGTMTLALDVPSGLNADSGAAMGAAIHATATLTFIGAKVGLFTGDGPDHAGTVVVADLGIDEEHLASTATLLMPDAVRGLLAQRKRNSHKGTFGAVGIIGGASGMAGAATLAARAALLLGAGKVFNAPLCEYSQGQDALHPEIMVRKARDLLDEKALTALVIGPGMGDADLAKNVLTSALKLDLPLVLDADALNLVAQWRGLQNAVAKRTAPTLLTPHPAEAARLLDTETAHIRNDRIAAACQLAERFKSVVVLKGAGSVVALPDGTWHINGTGNPGMASAGMGDTLSGMLGALLAQGMAAGDAAKLGVCLHGAAADACVADGIGPIGLAASEVALSARELLNRWVS